MLCNINSYELRTIELSFCNVLNLIKYLSVYNNFVLSKMRM